MPTAMLTPTSRPRLACKASPMLVRTPMLTLPVRPRRLGGLLAGLLLAVAATAWPAPARAAVGSWTSLLDGGPVWALAAHPTRRGWLFAGTKTNGVLRSIDGGATWHPASRGLANEWVRAFAIDPADPGVIFAGVQDSAPSLFKSTDGGNSWRSATGGLSFNTVLSLAVDPRRPHTIYAATAFGPASGVFRSTDGGASWKARNAGLPAGGVFALTLSPTTPGLLYAGATGVFRSADGGATWTAAGLASSNVAALALAPHSGALYAAADNGLFKSADGGRSWERQLDVAIASVAIDPAAPQDVYAGGAELWRSTDGGASWRRANADLQGFSVTAITPVPGARGLVVAGAADPIGFTGALFQSSDRGTSWAVGGRGLVDRNVLGFAIDPAAPSTLYASDADQGLFKSIDGGRHWTALTTPRQAPPDEGAGLVLDPTHPGSLYLVAGSLYKTMDGGATWQRLGTGPVPFFPPGTGQYDSLFVLGLAVDPSDPATLYGASVGAVLESSDGGMSWAALTRQDPDVLYFEIVVDPASPSTVYAAGAHFDAATSQPNGAALLKSTDAGATWVSIAQGLPAGLVQLAVEPAGARLYAGTFGGLFASGDGGASWERLAGITTEPVLAVAAPAKSQVFAVQAVAGVHWSRDGGDTWVALDRGLDRFPANVLAVFEPRPGTVAAGATAPASPGQPGKASRPAGPAATLYLGLAGSGLQSYSVP
jgi:photosystem II stability/assembly factor-like uncharacterized protein